MKSILALLCLTFAVSTVHARPLTKAQKLEDFNYLTSVINANYGPLEYKMSNKVVDIINLNVQFQNLIENTTSNRDFYYTLVKYVAAYKDGHFGIRVPSTIIKSRAVVTDLVDGKVLITGIDRTKVSKEQFPFEIGDEVVSVDGQPIKEYLDTTSLYVGNGSELSTRRATAWTVFFRRAARLPVPAAASVKFEIRRGTSETIEAGEMKWHVEGRGLDQMLSPTLEFANFGMSGGFVTLGRSNFNDLSNMAFQDFVHPDADRPYACSGTTRIAIPHGATVIMKEPFVAYYHPTPKGNVGYLRIPHYSPEEQPGKSELQVTYEWLAQYEFAIRELEKNTVGLVIDQDHNCGGSVWIVHKMISMFMDQPFKQTDFELLATKESFLDFGKWVDGTPKNTLDHEAVSKVLTLIETTWTSGTSRLTPKIAIDGHATMLPNPIRYTKPVVMLIDEMAGSGGDAFPAMMKGLGRAKLFGQTTSGLGGHIQMYPAGLPNSQMKFSLTKSLFYRPDGVAIENNGAVPDQFYTIKRDDVMYGFKEYQTAYLAYLSQFLP